LRFAGVGAGIAIEIELSRDWEPDGIAQHPEHVGDLECLIAVEVAGGFQGVVALREIPPPVERLDTQREQRAVDIDDIGVTVPIEVARGGKTGGARRGWGRDPGGRHGEED
jgi:hypothetical protein